MPAKSTQKCSFCGKSADMVNQLVGGLNGALICDECVKACHEMLFSDDFEDIRSSGSKPKKDAGLTLKKPADIKAVLDQYVIGQERAKRTLAVAVYNHYKRLQLGSKTEDGVELQKSNVLMLGPTGCGKTYLAQTLAKILNVPFAISDATTITEAGYVGEDVENVLLRLIQNADYDVERAERGIIYIDEIDKISRKGENMSITRDVSGEGVQQALLKIIEGTVSSVPPQGGRKHPMQEFIKIDTTNILFICGGAFDGIEKIIQSRIGKKVMGFGAEVKAGSTGATDDIMSQVKSEDLLKFGLIPEFIGRLPVVVSLAELDEDALQNILVEPKNALTKQYAKLMSMDNVELEFAPDALEEIAHLAHKRKSGARGLRAIIEGVMNDIMFEVPSVPNVKKCIVTKAAVLGEEKPTLIYNENSAD